MHGWAPEVTGAIGTPNISPEAYMEMFFTRSAASRLAGGEALRRIYARTQDRDTATTWATRQAQYDAEFAADVEAFLADGGRAASSVSGADVRRAG